MEEDFSDEPSLRESPASRVSIALGALVTPLAEQLTEQGVAFDPAVIERMQADNIAISRCYFGDLITYSIKERAQKKLCEKVFAHLRKHYAQAYESNRKDGSSPINPPTSEASRP